MPRVTVQNVKANFYGCCADSVHVGKLVENENEYVMAAACILKLGGTQNNGC